MSSANLVEIIGVPETVYGQTPDLATADALTARFTSESLSGTPTTTESEELRTDRMSGGQVVVGLESGGDINFELSRDPWFDKMFEMAMMDLWNIGAAPVADSVTQTKDGTNPQLATLVFDTMDVTNWGGSGIALAPGMILTLSGFTNEANNGVRQITSVTPPSTVQVVVPREATTEGPVAAVETGVPDWLDIGQVISSLTLSKAYQDVTHLASTDQHSQRYTGSIVSALALAIEYGAIITGTATYASNGYTQEAPSLHQQIEAAGGDVQPAGTAQPLNASVDMGLVTVDGMPTDFCIESLNIALDNGLTPQNCIGKLAPTKYALGTAAITIEASIYLSDTSYDAFMPKKLSQVPISILMATDNQDGGYAFKLTAVQLSFPDPAAGGANQQVMIDASGTAKVGPNGESSFIIYRF